jgi:hypothetical protein
MEGKECTRNFDRETISKRDHFEDRKGNGEDIRTDLI